MTEVEKSKLTQQFLQCIAQHLSGRADCKGVEYAVTIGHDTFEELVVIEPPKFVFPDRYQRAEINRISVIAHVAKTHFPELYIHTHDMLTTHVDTSQLVKGVYLYQSSFDKKKRRWVKLESL